MKQSKIKYKGIIEAYSEMGMESPSFIFNVDNIPGLYNWMTLKELKKIDNIVIKKEGKMIYTGSLTFERNTKYLVKKYCDFRPVEISEKKWLEIADLKCEFEFESSHVIRSLKEVETRPYNLHWSGNEDHEKDIDLIFCEEGFPLYYKEEDLFFQTKYNVLKYDSKLGEMKLDNNNLFLITRIK